MRKRAPKVPGLPEALRTGRFLLTERTATDIATRYGDRVPTITAATSPTMPLRPDGYAA